MISKLPEDIAGMSSGKPWANNSCMDVERNTGQAGSVFRHIRHGALVAYLVDTG